MSVEKLYALLFDTRSIQRYIYAGNRLRTNIGASYIVDCVFQDILIDEVLKEMFPNDKFTANNAWDFADDENAAWENMKSCCVAYIGGGNAMLLFKPSAENLRTDVVKNFTRKLLINRAGLKVGAAQGELNLIDGKLNQEEISKLYSALKDTQNKIFPPVNVPYSGLTLSCEIDGATADFCDTRGLVKPDGEIRFYSQETAIKADFSKKANDNLRERFIDIFMLKDFLPDFEFEFPDEVDKLGQIETENYFAIVHVDGNNMGLKFRACENLNQRRKLSREIRRKTEGAFADLLIKIIKSKNFLDEYLDLEENILPIRPLIIGGDDVTFICPANMAIMFTKTLMELMSSETPADSAEHLTLKNSRRMDCCAGIAILPTAYPFFRGYELAEQLCDEAKDAMRKSNIADGSSWLDFAILHGEQAPELEQIRKNEYSGARGNLHFGPYRVANSNAKNAQDKRLNIENLLECTTQFLSGKIMSKGKIKELRGVLQHGKDDAIKFIQQLENQKQSLPKISVWEDYLTDALWSNEQTARTPYVDAIELMDFYKPEVVQKWNLM